MTVLLLLGMSAVVAHSDEEPNPFVEAVRVLLQDHLQEKSGGAGGGLAAVGGFLHNIMQTDGGRQLSDALLTAGRSGGEADAGAGDLLSGLGSLLAAATGDHGPGAGKGGGGGLDPQLIGSVVNMFAAQMNTGEEDNNIDVNNNEVEGGKKRRVKEQGVDWGSMLNLAGNFLAGQQHGGRAAGADGAGLEGLVNLLPMLLQQQSVTHEQPRSRGGGAGARTPSLFGPLMDVAYDYWNHFTKSELGQMLWKNSGLEATSKLFTGEDGKFDMERIYRSLENASFRKRWIRNLSTYIADWVAHVSDPTTQMKFLSTAQFMGNSFLKAQGYPKSALFDPAKPAESLSRMVNSVFKRQFNLKVDSATYIKPAVSYLQEVYSIGQNKGLSFSHLAPKEIENKLTETINSEIIEPALRVWRAYRYSTKEPQCDKYVMCFVNKRDDAKLSSGLKPGVTKLSSLIASWFLSSNTGTSFWDLYMAATEDHNCHVKYPVDCNDFHAEDIKATTEYAHSEL